MNEKTIEKEKNTEIFDSISSLINEYDTSNLIKSFNIEEKKVSQFEDNLKRADMSKMAGYGTVALLYLVAVLAAEVFGGTNNSIVQGIVGIGLILLLSSGSYWYICRKSLKNSDISKNAAVYHRLSRAIKAYKKNDVPLSKQEFSSAMKIIRLSDASPFNPEFNQSLKDYNTDMETNDDQEEFFKNTFPEVGKKILHNMANIEESEIEYHIEENKVLEQGESTSVLNPIRTVFGRLKENRSIHAVGISILVGATLLITFQYNAEAAGVLAVFLTLCFQIYRIFM